MPLRNRRAALGIVVLFALSVRPALAAEPDCVKCHSAVIKHKVLHGPVSAGACQACHAKEVKGADSKKRHTFELAAEQPELCFQCHDAFKDSYGPLKNKHAAVDAGGCTACHSPHGSSQRLMLKGASMDRTCSACHDAKAAGKVVHPPVADSCANCHDPHGTAAPVKALLKEQPPQLCLRCHEPMQARLKGKFVHGPVQVGCGECHSPHSAEFPKLFAKDGRRDLCVSCHVEVGKYIEGTTHPHKALAQEKGCAGCHDPHTADQAPMLRDELATLCLSCHKEMKSELAGSSKHGPVRLNQCQGCHNPHGADNEKILKVEFPTKFYNAYEDGLYRLCFSCHEADIARDAKTTKLTNFRNGERNLHYVHVNSKKGRSCKACHAVHSGDQERHIRQGVPFGSWMLPIQYTATKTGGNCTVGCHTPKSYDRVKPVSYE